MFANILQYGLAMCLVENFLLVYLMQDFEGTPKWLLGAAVAVMCAFEVPVFKYIDRLWKHHGIQLTTVIVGCQLILILRCLLYMLLPSSAPICVLFIEPLHGITFAAMWVATVECGRRLASPNATARMQTLINGIWYQISMGVGAVGWGILIEDPPQGLGFHTCFLVDIFFVLLWCGIWVFGLRVRARSSGERAATMPRLLEESAHR